MGRNVADETWVNQADRVVELIREALSTPENPNPEGRAMESVGKRRFLMTEDAQAGRGRRIAGLAKDFNAMKPGAGKRRLGTLIAALCGLPDAAADGGEWIPAERVGWNAWRHTFATLRAQAGVSLDKISAWMGNTPDVYRRHYAQFVPRGAEDEDIDR